MEFHTRDRLVAHLAYRSDVCRLNLLRLQQPLADDEVQALDVSARDEVRKLAAQGRRRCHAQLKCFRLCGPLTLILDASGATIHGIHPLGNGRRWQNS